MISATEIGQILSANVTLESEILAILNAAEEPLSCAAISLLSELAPDRETLSREIFRLKKAGIITAVGEVGSQSGSRANCLVYRPASGAIQLSPLPEKEKSMQAMHLTPKQPFGPKVTVKNIRDLVIASPGILRDDVYQALIFSDGSNRKKVQDLVYVLISSKQLIQTDNDGKKYLHPGPLIKAKRKEPKTAGNTKKPVGKLLTGAEARPSQIKQASIHTHNDEGTPNDEVVIPTFLLKEAQPTIQKPVAVMPTHFRCALFTDGTMILDIPGNGRIELAREATRDLVSYMQGIADYAVNDLNL